MTGDTRKALVCVRCGQPVYRQHNWKSPVCASCQRDAKLPKGREYWHANKHIYNQARKKKFKWLGKALPL